MSYADVEAAHDALVTALEAASAALPTDQTFRVLAELDAPAHPPLVVLAPPTLRWEGPVGSGPRAASWVVAMAVSAGGRVVSEMYQLLPAVVAALEAVGDAVVTQAEPGVYRAGSIELPSYFITVEVAL